jgi:D-methionine transport system ATP-binding protein
MIEIQSVSQRFDGPGGAVDALSNVSLSIPRGEIFGVIGHSGAGKSTLIRTLNLLNRPTSGRVLLDGQDLTALDARRLREARRKIGMIFQHFNLLSSRTVFGNIALPLELAGVDKVDIRRRVGRLLDVVDLAALADRYPAQISGGQKQRVGIARALANEPKVLLSDEATSALDPETTASILGLLKNINRQMGLTIVLITHQMDVVKQICDRMAVMEAGRVVETGRVIDVFLTPRHDVTRTMIGGVMSHELPEAVLRRVRAKLAENTSAGIQSHLYRLGFVGSSVEEALLSQVARRFDLNFSILHGQVDEIQEQTFGSLAVLVKGGAAQVDPAIAFLREHGVTVEELDHVVSND